MTELREIQKKSRFPKIKFFEPRTLVFTRNKEDLVHFKGEMYWKTLMNRNWIASPQELKPSICHQEETLAHIKHFCFLPYCLVLIYQWTVSWWTNKSKSCNYSQLGTTNWITVAIQVTKDSGWFFWSLEWGYLQELQSLEVPRYPNFKDLFYDLFISASLFILYLKSYLLFNCIHLWSIPLWILYSFIDTRL